MAYEREKILLVGYISMFMCPFIIASWLVIAWLWQYVFQPKMQLFLKVNSDTCFWISTLVFNCGSFYFTLLIAVYNFRFISIIYISIKYFSFDVNWKTDIFWSFFIHKRLKILFTYLWKNKNMFLLLFKSDFYGFLPFIRQQIITLPNKWF